MRTNVVKCCVLAATIGLSVPAHAEKLATILLKEGDTTRVAIYAAECGLEGYHECVRADLGCGGPGEFKASMFGFGSKEAGAILSRDDGKGSVAFGDRRIPLRTQSLEYSDSDGDWFAVLALSDGSTNVWDPAVKPGPVAIGVGGRTIAAPQTDAARKDLSALFKACAPRK